MKRIYWMKNVAGIFAGVLIVAGFVCCVFSIVNLISSDSMIQELAKTSPFYLDTETKQQIKIAMIKWEWVMFPLGICAIVGGVAIMKKLKNKEGNP